MMRLNSRGEESTRGCRWLVAVGLLLALAPACRQAQGERMMADLVLWNGRIFTVDREKPWVEAVAVRDGVIREVGANRALKRWIGKGTEVVDLGGKLMLPGFNDAHVHLADGGFDLLGIRLRDSRDETDFAARIRAYVLRLPKGEWVTGGYWDHETWPTHRYPRRRLIDPFTADHPLLVQRLDGHIALANGAALRLAGISRVTPDPQGGEIEKDPQTGELSGILKDAAIGLVEKVIPPPDRKKRERAIRAALTHASELGLTSVQDNSSPEDLLIYQDLLGRGELSVRLNAWRGADFYKDFARIGIRPGFGCTALRLGTIKLFADGSMGAGTALFYEPYSDDPATAGLAIYPQKELNDLIRDVDRAGLQLAIHAIGDKANAWVLDALETAAAANGRRDARHRIEHAQVVRPEDVDRFRDLGVIASIQPSHCIDDMRWAEKRIGVRVKQAYLFNSFIKAGVHVAFGSDWFVESLNPLLGIYAAVTREYPEGGPEGGWFSEEKISLEKAIECYTLGSAFAEFQENVKGSITAGKLADLVVLDRDLFKISRKEILQTKVVMTILGGNIVFNKN